MAASKNKNKEQDQFSNKRQREESPLLRLASTVPILSVSTMRDDVVLRDCPSFYSNVFRQQALYIKGFPERHEKISMSLFDLDSRQIIEHTASDNCFVWIATPEGRLRSMEVSDPATAHALHQAGHATYCRAPPDLESALVQALMVGPGRGEVEIFQGTSQHTTDWHFDFQENFTFQLSGTKRWSLQHSTVRHPLRGCTPHYQSSDVVESQLLAGRLSDPSFQYGHTSTRGGVEEVTLSPGDFLYFPAGMWHKVETVEAGVSLNVSLMADSYAAVTCHALQHVLMQRDEWRQNLLGENVVQHLEQLLTELPSLIQQFRDNAGARAILPQAILRPNDTRCEEEDDEEEQGVELDGDDVEDDIDERDSDEDTVNEAEVVRLPFVPPEGESWGLSRDALASKFVKEKLIQSPLVAWIRRDAIGRYYGRDTAGDTQRYVANFGFAGNEGHESTRRLVFEDSPALLSKLERGEEIEWLKYVNSAESRNMLDCLVYHGVLLWVPR